jgi:hypothetical protein
MNVDDLESFIDESIRVSRAHDYYPTVFVGMRARHGTIPTIEKASSERRDPERIQTAQTTWASRVDD